MKYFLLLLISFTLTSINAQSLSNQEIKKLSKLDLEFTKIDQNNFQLTQDLRKILLAEKQRKSNKMSGIIFTSLSAISIGYGILIASSPKDSFWQENPQSGTVGGLLIGSGIIEGGIGIPLLFVSKNRKKQRGKLILEYQNQLE